MRPVIKRTDAEIAQELKWLRDNKAFIPRTTAFGDSNWDAIDAQIMVLENRWSEQEVWDRESDEDWCGRVLDNARDAAMWLEGEDENQPSAQGNWGALVRKHDKA